MGMCLGTTNGVRIWFIDVRLMPLNSHVLMHYENCPVTSDSARAGENQAMTRIAMITVGSPPVLKIESDLRPIADFIALLLMLTMYLECYRYITCSLNAVKAFCYRFAIAR